MRERERSREIERDLRETDKGERQIKERESREISTRHKILHRFNAQYAFVLKIALWKLG